MRLPELHADQRITRSILIVMIPLLVAGSAGCQSGGRLLQDGQVDWNRYYSNDETNAIMQHYARRYPDLTDLYSIGKSYLGVDLMVMEVTNSDRRPAAEKPGFYVFLQMNDRKLWCVIGPVFGDEAAMAVFCGCIWMVWKLVAFR